MLGSVQRLMELSGGPFRFKSTSLSQCVMRLGATLKALPGPDRWGYSLFKCESNRVVRCAVFCQMQIKQRHLTERTEIIIRHEIAEDVV